MLGWKTGDARRLENHPVVKLTYDDFVHFPDDGLRHELIDGEHYVTPSPATRHQRIVVRLAASLYTYFEANGSGEVFVAPLDVVLSVHDVVEPDLLVVVAGQANIVTRMHVRGAPAIVVEVLSAHTRRRDETLKRELYRRTGVREYWMIDPERDVVTIVRFGGSDAASSTLTRGRGTELTSSLLPDWSVSIDWLLNRTSESGPSRVE